MSKLNNYYQDQYSREAREEYTTEVEMLMQQGMTEREAIDSIELRELHSRSDY